MNSKPLKERISRLFEMTELSRNIILNQLHIKRPELNEIDLKIELFRAFYRFDFDNETLDKIATKMKQYLLSEQIEKQTIKSV